MPPESSIDAPGRLAPASLGRRAERRDELVAVFAGREADVDFRARGVGYGVARVAAGDAADVDGGAAVVVGKSLCAVDEA